MRTAITLFIVAAVAYGCSPVNKWIGWQDDHPLEQISEDVIESYTGIRTDLTPENSEF